MIPAKKLGLAGARHVKIQTQKKKKEYNWLVNYSNEILWLIRHVVAATCKQGWRPMDVQQNNFDVGKVIQDKSSIGPPSPAQERTSL